MKLQEKISQHRRDFVGKFKCESCNHEEQRSGYDDNHYHTEVIPDMKCGNCGKSTREMGGQIDPPKTKYPEGMTV